MAAGQLQLACYEGQDVIIEKRATKGNSEENIQDVFSRFMNTAKYRSE